MQFTRRQMVEGGLVAGFLGLAAKPVFAAAAEDPADTLAVRRRPDQALAANGASPAPRFAQPLRQPHPGQPLPSRPSVPIQPQQQQIAAVRPAAPPIARVPAQPRVAVERTVNPRLVAAARASFDQHRRSVRHTDVVGIVDFSKVSREPRYYLLDTNSGRVSEHHVSHGRGSDPAHTGFVQRFSNRPGSLATSEGGYVTSEYYTGKYGASMRVRGLDWSNSNAEARAIVIHPAWYAEPSHLAVHGILGRSEGCFAMSRASLSETLDRLSPGHFPYAVCIA
jgi:hypothetical protein